MIYFYFKFYVYKCNSFKKVKVRPKKFKTSLYHVFFFFFYSMSGGKYEPKGCYAKIRGCWIWRKKGRCYFRAWCSCIQFPKRIYFFLIWIHLPATSSKYAKQKYLNNYNLGQRFCDKDSLCLVFYMDKSVQQSMLCNRKKL